MEQCISLPRCQSRSGAIHSERVLFSKVHHLVNRSARKPLDNSNARLYYLSERVSTRLPLHQTGCIRLMRCPEIFRSTRPITSVQIAGASYALRVARSNALRFITRKSSLSGYAFTTSTFVEIGVVGPRDIGRVSEVHDVSFAGIETRP